MANSTGLQNLIKPVVESLGYELVGLEFYPRSHNSTVRIYIDSPAGIGVEDCTRVSHQVSGILEVEDPIPGRYTLEVSSPGSDRPLFEPRHYQKVVGSRVRVKMHTPVDGRKNFIGQLKQVDDDAITVEVDNQEYRLCLAEIEIARLATD